MTRKLAKGEVRLWPLHSLSTFSYYYLIQTIHLHVIRSLGKLKFNNYNPRFAVVG